MAKTYMVKRNNKVGRYVVLAQGLKAGEEVLSEIPFVVGPKSGTLPVCLGCYRPVDCLVVCSACGWPVCDDQCEALPAHQQAECTVFADANMRYQKEDEDEMANGSPQYECITPLRMLLKKESDTERWETEIKDMESHCEIRKTLPYWAAEHCNVVEFLRRKCRLADRFGEDLIHWAVGVLEVNSFEVRTEDGYFVRGLYPQTAMMSHNCVANTTHTIYPADSFRNQLRTTVDMSMGDELFVSYTSSIQPTVFRRENLKYSKYFDCDCQRCADPTELDTHLSTLKCTKCDNGIILSSNPLDQKAIWNCKLCEFTIKSETVQRIFKMIQSEVDYVESFEDFDSKLQESERLLKKYRSVLHPRNVYMICLSHVLLQLYGRAPGYTFEDLPDILLERKIELCRQVLKVADVVKPGLNRFRGLVLYELHVPLMIFNKHRYDYGEFTKEEFKEKMEEVAKILEEAVNALCLEDPTSPEGDIGQTGKESLAQLKVSIEEL